MGGNSTIVRIWWTTFIGVIQPSQRRPEKPKSVLFDETSTDFIPGTNASATWALSAQGVALVGSTRALRIGIWRCGLGTWRTQGCLLYLGALLHLPFFFRFVCPSHNTPL